MSSKNLRIICIWNEDEFTIIESKNSPSKEEAYLIIDESSEKMDVHIPSKFSIVQKRIIERQAYSIAKSGFLLPKSSIRIGMGFDVTISKDDSIPETLLQVGHHYSLDKPTSPYIESSTPEFESKKMPDSNYQPSYLLYDSFSTKATITPTPSPTPQPVTTPTQIPKPETTPISTPKPTPPPETISITITTPQKSETDRFKYDDETLAGRIIINLSKTGDIYFSRTKDKFIVEFSKGQVEFSIRNNEIIIHSTKRISANDSILEQAIKSAKS